MSQLFVTCAPGVEPILVDELAGLGIEAKAGRGGVKAEADLKAAYQICLWSRLASRVLWPLVEGEAEDGDAVYELAASVDWPSQFAVSKRFAVDFTGTSKAIRHSQFGAQKVKDAIVDVFREDSGRRPSVDVKEPEIRVHAHLGRSRLQIYLDLAGKPLHQRGYRQQAGVAPMKENLAAAILYRLGWHKGGFEALVDPLCGSGTLVIEAALMAGNRAPGLRRGFAFEHWLGHRKSLWSELVEAAIDAAIPIKASLTGYDMDKRVIEKARINAKEAGIGRNVTFTTQSLGELGRPAESHGLLVCNPPYGERLGDSAEVLGLYHLLGSKLRLFQGWKAGVYTGAPESLRQLKLVKDKQWQLNNGALECVLASYSVDESQGEMSQGLPKVVEPFVNRLKKNLVHLQKWAKREGVDAYRLYDADLPEFNAAIDRYGDHVVIQEYAAPKTIDPAKAAKRLQDMILAVMDVTGVSPKNLAVKTRTRQSGKNQYEKLHARKEFMQVQEYGVRCRVNLYDYLDTGLFLDHRLTRKMLGEMAGGKRFLNLFCYTGTATLHAARGGAISTTSVDMSKTYLNWAQDNMRVNGFTGPNHHFVQENCIKWLKLGRDQFDLIFVDPPTFSNSKRMEDSFDVQRDHVALLRAIKARLVPGGEVVFSNNKRHFKLDQAALEDMGFEVKDISRQTLPEDYKRNPHIHVCYLLRSKA
ncbi:bifunctional 23S rRNA (guanine(2069)-N(7))-methyltransferase RlmK/23S rRNA (guanine(2445)-N(2))-methyltransferase RlmL [Gallaecimonas sp. GXIMD4217]|uniref:bifunctional 23S rRNA (guanine(2069)-N(7))-methyltransferase RlmK/23S rRNA (guanine(2445)-N(2))-methyltransferase RlmL n=1 Tax=Gallaecimonas sp. GXIMD4217 TaxID=3131927 RepID=UPI00311B0377